jgi:hypothetical protein
VAINPCDLDLVSYRLSLSLWGTLSKLEVTMIYQFPNDELDMYNAISSEFGVTFTESTDVVDKIKQDYDFIDITDKRLLDLAFDYL